jgi:hypothetical protein
MRKCLFYAVLGASVLSTAAFANTLTPGQEMQSPDVLNLTGMTLLASTSGSLNSLTFNASYNTAVLKGGSNPYCATCLTFAYQVTDTSAVGPGTGIIEDLTASMFPSFSTDVGYAILGTASDGFITAGTMPLTVGRSAAGSGSVISFDYPDQGIPGNDLLPGDHTAVLLIETDATTYTAGMFSAIDGATATATAFQPTSATPEPNSLALAGLAFVGIALLLKRIRHQA